MDGRRHRHERGARLPGAFPEPSGPGGAHHGNRTTHGGRRRCLPFPGRHAHHPIGRPGQWLRALYLGAVADIPLQRPVVRRDAQFVAWQAHPQRRDTHATRACRGPCPGPDRRRLRPGGLCRGAPLREQPILAANAVPESAHLEALRRRATGPVPVRRCGLLVLAQPQPVDDQLHADVEHDSRGGHPSSHGLRVSGALRQPLQHRPRPEGRGLWLYAGRPASGPLRSGARPSRRACSRQRDPASSGPAPNGPDHGGASHPTPFGADPAGSFCVGLRNLADDSACDVLGKPAADSPDRS